MKKSLKAILRMQAGLFVSVCIAACATSPTGRNQLRLFPETEMVRMGITAYDEMKTRVPLGSDQGTIAYVSCVAKAITIESGAGYDWEVNVFNDQAVNAFALPGGKIGVYTGLLEVAVTQDQLAAVIGHEVAHVLAAHGNERVSVAYATETGLRLTEVLAGAATPEKTQLLGLLGLGVQFGVLLPYDRTQESEADIIGMDYMARAGFHPQAAIDLWRNMANAGDNRMPELLSTHPSGTTRISNLQEHLPVAMSIYLQASASKKQPACR